MAQNHKGKHKTFFWILLFYLSNYGHFALSCTIRLHCFTIKRHFKHLDNTSGSSGRHLIYPVVWNPNAVWLPLSLPFTQGRRRIPFLKARVKLRSCISTHSVFLGSGGGIPYRGTFKDTGSGGHPLAGSRGFSRAPSPGTRHYALVKGLSGTRN